jgi:uncharacterized membrane protein
MLATVVWIGSLATLFLLVLPAAQRSLEAQAYTKLIVSIQHRLDPLGWFCLALLVGTGMVQMSANPNYQGFLAIDNAWAVAILVKHLLFLVIVGISAYLTWGLLPKSRRMALRRVRGLESLDGSANQELVNQEARLVRLTLILAVLVLALTAIARAS